MKTARKYYRWILVILWMSLIFILSHQDASRSSQLSGGLLIAVIDVLTGVFKGFTISPETLHFLLRKGSHFFAYLILGILTAHAISPLNRKEWLWTLVICTLYAASDEYHQTFIPGRSGEFRDVLIDTAGSFTGIMLFGLFIKVMKKRNEQKSIIKAT